MCTSFVLYSDLVPPLWTPGNGKGVHTRDSASLCPTRIPVFDLCEVVGRMRSSSGSTTRLSKWKLLPCRRWISRSLDERPSRIDQRGMTISDCSVRPGSLRLCSRKVCLTERRTSSSRTSACSMEGRSTERRKLPRSSRQADVRSTPTMPRCSSDDFEMAFSAGGSETSSLWFVTARAETG